MHPEQMWPRLLSHKGSCGYALSEEVERGLGVPATQENGLAMAEFKRAFLRLSPTHREALVLVGVHGLRYEDVAAITGCEIGTVKSRVFRARELLKGMLLDGDAPAQPRSTSRRSDERRPPARQGTADL